MSRVPTLADVARAAGVSLATASRSLSGSERVTPSLRQLVVAAAAQLGYEANPHARALASAGEATIGVVLHDLANPFFTELVRGMDEVAAGLERTLLFIAAHRDPQRELQAVAHFRVRRVEALVIAGSGLEDRQYASDLDAQLAAFEASGGRAVLVGRHHGRTDAVLLDNVGGARSAVRELIELGHRRLGVICGPETVTTTRERLAGVRQALAGSEGAAGPRLAFSDYTREGGAAAAARLLDGRAAERPTAIVAFNDLMAIGALAEARRRGLRVPAELSVFGFDDIPVAVDVEPALTTVHVPAAEMGALAIRVGLEARRSSVRVEHLGTHLVRRASTGPAPA